MRRIRFLAIAIPILLTPVLAHAQSTQLFAQNDSIEEVLRSPSWQIVPGARVGKNSADTLIDVNNIKRKGNVVTFDITGYQSFYYRLQGDCSTRQVRLLRRGLLGGGERVNYRSVSGEDKVFEFHRNVVNFACQQTRT